MKEYLKKILMQLLLFRITRNNFKVVLINRDTKILNKLEQM